MGALRVPTVVVPATSEERVGKVRWRRYDRGMVMEGILFVRSLGEWGGG